MVRLVLLATVFSAVFDGALRQAKPKRLLMLGMAAAEQTATGVKVSPSCMAGARVALEAANADPNFLSDYAVDLTTKDDGPTAPKNLVTFIDAYLNNKERLNNTFLSPIMVGSTYACQTWSGIIRYFNMVQFAHGCSGSLFTDNRVRFPNMYRVLIPAEQTTPTMISFSKYYGKWRQVGVISNAANSITDLMARQFYTSSTSNGIEVVLFSSVQNIDVDGVTPLKDSDARAVAIFVIEPPLFVRFLCIAHQLGIRGPRYAFIAMWRSFVDPSNPGVPVPPVCTLSMLDEQTKITFYVGPITQTPTNFGMTALGYDLIEFERRYNRLINYTRYWDLDFRQQCHDNMLAALFSLDKADRLLRSKYNLTLSDLETNGNTVMKAVNDSAANMDIMGIRVGRMTYSKRVEFDFEPIYILQWKKSSLQPVIKYQIRSPDLVSGDLVNIDLFNVTLVDRLIWATRSGSPPKDLANIHVQIDTLPTYLLPVTCTLAFCLAVFKLYPVKKLVLKVYEKQDIFYRFSDALILTGCLAMDVSAILFSTNPFGIRADCYVQIIVAALGLSLIHGCQFAHLSVAVYVTNNMKVDMAFKRKKTESRLSGLFSPRPHHSSSEIMKRSMSQKKSATGTKDQVFASAFKLATLASVVFAFANLIVLSVWFANDNAPKVISFVSGVYFDNADDSYYRMRTDVCFSPVTEKWLGSLAFIHGILLAMASCFAVQTRRIPFESSLAERLRFTRTSTWNTTMLFVVLALLQVLIPTQHASVRANILCFGALVYSATSSGTVANFAKSLNN